MKAKDTVMNDMVLKHRFNVGRVGIGDWLREVLGYQAEISFKAGREAEREFILQNTDRDIRARKEGIREVVDWVEANKFSLVAMDNYCDFGIDNAKWQAKFKE